MAPDAANGANASTVMQFGPLADDLDGYHGHKVASNSISILNSVDDYKQTANYISKNDFNSNLDEEDFVLRTGADNLIHANEKRRTQPLTPLAEEVENFGASARRAVVKRPPMDPD